jgi:hypothetical protein
LWTGWCANAIIGFGVYSGRLTAENATEDKALNVYQRYNVNFLGPACDGYPFPTKLQPFQTITYNVDIGGYYNGTSDPLDPDLFLLNPFSPGVYTLFVADIWDHLATRYFTVLST